MSKPSGIIVVGNDLYDQAARFLGARTEPRNTALKLEDAFSTGVPSGE